MRHIYAKENIAALPHLPLEYLLRKPMIAALHPPLLILLHGYGSNEEDLFSLASLLPPEFLVIAARAPYVLTSGQYAWFHLDFSSGKMVHNEAQAEKSRLLLKHFIDEAAHAFAVDTTRISLVGFSQGAILSASVALTFPSLVCAIAMLSGRILEEIKPLVQKREAFKQFKVFLAHGTEDTVLPVSYAREAKVYLEELGVKLEYREYALPHTISGDECAALTLWLSTLLHSHAS
jgi:phospholipase/carboxylesterase